MHAKLADHMSLGTSMFGTEVVDALITGKMCMGGMPICLLRFIIKALTPEWL